MQRQWRWCAPGLLAAALALTSSGCGAGNGLTLGRVQGKITYKGEPVKYGTVSFVPDATKGSDGPMAMGNIKEDGTYILSTSDAGDGAVVGHHKISVIGLDPVPVNPDDKPLPTPDEAPLEYMKTKGKALRAAPVRLEKRPRRRGTRSPTAGGGSTATSYPRSSGCPTSRAWRWTSRAVPTPSTSRSPRTARHGS